MYKYNWFRDSIAGKVCLVVMSFLVMSWQCIPIGVITAMAAEKGGYMGKVTIGGRFGEEYSTGMLDILAPLNGDQNYLIFINPRVSITDEDAEEYNLGIGSRVLIDKLGVILGGNVYYDVRSSEAGNDFDQIGVGLEVLSKWIDGRLNVYIADDSAELKDTYTTERTYVGETKARWGGIKAKGHTLTQDRIYATTYITEQKTYNQYESAMDGMDAEVGVRLPYIDKIAETRVFVGYQKYDNPFGKDLSGWKARLEVRPLPGVILDAEYYDEEKINDSDYALGVRIQLPFSIASIAEGKCPFGNVKEQFKKGGEMSLADRMTEMVIRDMKVQLEASSYIEDEARRVVSSHTVTQRKKVVLTNSGNFVDGDNVSGIEDGTYEHPYNTIGEGVANAFGDKVVIVDGAAKPYTENVVLTSGVKLHGVYYGFGGKTFGTRPVVLGDGQGPTITMAENTRVSGFMIKSQGNASGIVMVSSPNGGSDYDVTRAGIVSENNSGLIIDHNEFADVSYGAVIVDTLSGANDSFVANISENKFNNGTESGLVIDTKGASGTFNVELKGNQFNNNAGDGLYVDAEYYDIAYLSVVDAQANNNGGYGITAWLYGDEATIYMKNVEANYNVEGVDAGVVAYGDNRDGTIIMQNVVANHNEYWGIYYAYATAYGAGGNAVVILDDVTANYNNGGGVDVLAEAYGTGGNASIVMNNIQANYNRYYGIYEAYAYSDDGSTSVQMNNVQANNNEGYGIEYVYAEAYGTGGNASIVMNNIQANYNDYEGIYEIYAYSAESNASVQMNNVQANYNRDSGIYDVWVESDGGSASVQMSNVQTIYNDYYGIEYVWAEAYGTGGNASIVMNNVQVNGNYYHGIYEIYAYSDDGSASVQMSNVQANDNDGDGIEYIEAYAYGTGGNASIVMNNVQANNNDEYGISDVYAEAYGTGGNASIVMNNVQANDNYYDGIYYIYAYSDGGNASVQMSNVQANNNDDDGISDVYVEAYGTGGNVSIVMNNVQANDNYYEGIYYIYAYSGDGSASVQMNNVQANYNGECGIDYIEVYAYGTGGNASIAMNNVQANYNEGDGLSYVYGYSDDGDVTVDIRNSTVRGNAGYGIYISLEASDNAGLYAEYNVITENADDGLRIENVSSITSSLELRYNSIYGNGSYDVNNTGADTVDAENNWWGQDPPDSGQFNGAIDYDPWLSYDPNL